MENQEMLRPKAEKLTPTEVVALFESIRSDRLALVEEIANKRGLSSIGMVKNFIEVHAEEYPNNPRLKEILVLLKSNMSDPEFSNKVEELAEELIDLIQ
jgi:hypothetical protein